MAVESIWYNFGGGVAGFFENAANFSTKADNDNDFFTIDEKNAIRAAVYGHLREGKLTRVGTRPGAKFLLQGTHENNPGTPIFTVFKCADAEKNFFKMSVFNQLELTPFNTIADVAKALKTNLSIAIPLNKPQISLVHG